MSDALLFAALFATFGVLGGSYAGGPDARARSSSCRWSRSIPRSCWSPRSPTALPCSRWQAGRRRCSLAGWSITALLGAASSGSSCYEFAHLIAEGATPQRSGFLSAFFTLVSTHGLHVTVGIIWIGVMLVQLAQARADRRQPPPPAVPQHVLALPRRRLDRRIHLRLPAGNDAMSAATRPRHAAHGRRAMGTARSESYLIGFALSAVLTAIPFWLVMTGALGSRGRDRRGDR